MTTTKDFAEKLDLCEYTEEIGARLVAEAEENGIVVVFGSGDEEIVFRGAIDNCVDGYYEGGEVMFTKGGKFLSIENIEHLEEIEDVLEIKIPLPVNKIEAIWDGENEQGEIIAHWTYKTEIPHEKFRIMEDEDLYCIGIVFSINDLK